MMTSKAAASDRDPQAPVPSQEVFGPTIEADGKDLSIPKISYGLPFDEAIVQHVAPNAKVYVLASKTISEKTNSLDRLKTALGARVKGVRVGMTPHTMFQECLEVTDEARKIEADTIVTLGAGSLSDAAKFVCKALTNDISTIAQLEKHTVNVKDGKWVGPQGHNPPHRQPRLHPDLALGRGAHAIQRSYGSRHQAEVPDHGGTGERDHLRSLASADHARVGLAAVRCSGH